MNWNWGFWNRILHNRLPDDLYSISFFFFPNFDINFEQIYEIE